MVLQRRLELLAECEEIDIRGAQIVPHLQHFMTLLA
jgi:hypothetical protein